MRGKHVTRHMVNRYRYRTPFLVDFAKALAVVILIMLIGYLIVAFTYGHDVVHGFNSFALGEAI